MIDDEIGAGQAPPRKAMQLQLGTTITLWDDQTLSSSRKDDELEIFAYSGQKCVRGHIQNDLEGSLHIIGLGCDVWDSIFIDIMFWDEGNRETKFGFHLAKAAAMRFGEKCPPLFLMTSNPSQRRRGISVECAAERRDHYKYKPLPWERWLWKGALTRDSLLRLCFQVQDPVASAQVDPRPLLAESITSRVLAAIPDSQSVDEVCRRLGLWEALCRKSANRVLTNLFKVDSSIRATLSAALAGSNKQVVDEIKKLLVESGSIRIKEFRRAAIGRKGRRGSP